MDKRTVTTVRHLSETKTVNQFQAMMYLKYKSTIYDVLYELFLFITEHVNAEMKTTNDILMVARLYLSLDEYDARKKCFDDIMELKKKKKSVYFNFPKSRKTIKFILDNIYKIEETNILNILFLNDDLIILFKPASYYRFPCISSEENNNLLKKIISNTESIIKHCKEVIKYVTSFFISNIPNNKDFYQNLQPEIDGSETNVCLICSEIVNNLCYARFAECDHKICSDCVNKMIITNGSCPFHSNEIKNLVVCIPTQSINDQSFSIKQYMESNYQMIITAVFNETVSAIVQISETTMPLKEYIESIIALFKKITKRMDKKEKERIKTQIREINLRIINANMFCDCRKFKLHFKFLQNTWKMVELFKTEDMIKNEYITSAVNLFNDHLSKLYKALLDVLQEFRNQFARQIKGLIEESYDNLFKQNTFHLIQHSTLPCELYNKVVSSLQNHQN